MNPATKRNLTIGGVVFLAIVALVVAFLLGRSTGKEEVLVSTVTTPAATATTSTATTPTATTNIQTATTVAVDNTQGSVTPSEPVPGPGPYSTMDAAVAFVQGQPPGLTVLEPGSTWASGSTMHVIHATPSGSASYGGDIYYFFVNGYFIGEKRFTSSVTHAFVDGTTFAVTFNVYSPGDPHCCPSGGTSTVQFHWDGSYLVTIGSMAGAEM